MGNTTGIGRRQVLRQGIGLAMTAGAGGWLAGCGGGGGGGGSGDTGGTAPQTNPNISALDAATFMIGLTFSGSNGQWTSLLGTGFAIDDNLIATNAHVTDGVIESAASVATFARVVKVSAFQSETGREFALLKAAVHPSYSGSTRSPDIGLFESRDPLPAKLTLETAEGTTRLRKGDPLQQNGFPGDLFNLIHPNYQPGLSVARSTLYSGTIQTIDHFDSRVVVDPTKLSTIDMYQHSMDTSGGTSGSPILNGGKVIAVHNSGPSVNALVIGPNGDVVVERVPTGTGSWGVNVKHLHNLVNFYRTGVLEADKSFSLPPPDALVLARFNAQQGAGGGQSAGGGAGSNFNGTVANPTNTNVAHQFTLRVGTDLAITGTSQWPANPSLSLGARSFALSGVSSASGRFEFRDNTPEVIPGFRRGVYLGLFNPASGRMTGEYYELNETTGELFYFGDWTATR